MNPSKELLSEVLGRPITKIQKADNTLLAYWDIYSAQHSLINIHELVFKCILHFYDDFIFDISAYEIKITKIVAFREPEEVYSDCWMNIPYDINKTFKACQWILNNKDKLWD